MYSRRKDRREGQRLGGEERRTKDVEDLEQRIPGEWGSLTINTEGRKGKMGELVESRLMFKAERSQSHREGSLGNGRRERETP